MLKVMKVLAGIFDNMAMNRLLVLTLYFVDCRCNSQWNKYIKDLSFSDKMCPTEQVKFQKVTRSAADCVRTCDGTPDCASLIYLFVNMTCFGIKSYNPFSTSTPLQGAVFYKLEFLSPGTPMVEGLPDSQFTASGFLASSWDTRNARFSSTNSWIPAIQDTNQWLQVDFTHQVLATYVATKGFPNNDYWVTSYKILTSTDCINFDIVQDVMGNDKIFPGNTDRHTPVQHALEPPVTCRCFRINPWTWSVQLVLRLEVLGHIL